MEEELPVAEDAAVLDVRHEGPPRSVTALVEDGTEAREQPQLVRGREAGRPEAQQVVAVEQVAQRVGRGCGIGEEVDTTDLDAEGGRQRDGPDRHHAILPRRVA